MPSPIDCDLWDTTLDSTAMSRRLFLVAAAGYVLAIPGGLIARHIAPPPAPELSLPDAPWRPDPPADNHTSPPYWMCRRRFCHFCVCSCKPQEALGGWFDSHRDALAATLRAHLKRAGVTRRALHEAADTSKHMTFHDLRASGISWLAMLPGWTQFDVRDYAGHSEVSTTDLYVSRGRKAAGVVAAPFGELPASLLGVSIVVSDANRSHETITSAEPEACVSDSRGLLASPRGHPQY